ncbi:hypothetical protein HAYMO_301 [Serratia phage vB_SmaM_Haymo]|uniref:Uncharacterized protein n=1 Tax=Serratia phage vB_SmaM_Yaphecito TaxID=2777368 RepID=A0A7T3TLT5_9CAUD|nr:hypothetical protein [Serratia phage vB_SmaM_Yaphecito]UGO54283.1 hypothetical protein HAYMO_301 [Serratia phage vB_SmaM_Haymo]
MKKEKMVKVEIVVNGQHRLTRIFDVDDLNAVSDAIVENKEVFSGDEFKQLTDNYMESVKWRIRDGFIGVIGLGTSLNISACVSKPTDLELQRVSVSLRAPGNLSTRLIRTICYRGEIHDMFSLFKVNLLRRLSLTARAFLSSLKYEDWSKLRSGDNELALMGSDYTLKVTPVGQPAEKIVQIFTPVEVGAVSDSPQAIKKDTIDLPPELLEAIGTVSELHRRKAQNGGRWELRELANPELQLKVCSAAVSPITDWASSTLQYLVSPRRVGKHSVEEVFKKLSARHEELQALCKRGEDMSKVIVYRGSAEANGKKTNFVLTYDMVYGKQGGFSWVIDRVARQIKRNLGEDISPPILYHAFHITNLGRWVELVPGLEVRIEAVL